MLYILAILLPPLAVLFTGRIFQFIFNLILAGVGLIFAVLTFGGVWILAIIHAIIVVHSYRQDKRDARLVRAVRGDKK